MLGLEASQEMGTKQMVNFFCGSLTDSWMAGQAPDQGCTEILQEAMHIA
jgi:hypothetical protein